MKKLGLRLGLALVLMMAGLAFVNSGFAPGQEGDKEITLIFNIDGEKGVETMLELDVQTDLTLLGELLDEVLAKQGLAFVTSGSKNDPFGRFVLQIGAYETKNMDVGPWWMFSSDTNEDCVSAGYCPGIDMTPLYDQDIFTFIFSSSY